MVAADLTVTAKRAEVLDFSMPFMNAYLTVLTTVKICVCLLCDVLFDV